MKSEKINPLPHPFLHWFHHLVVYYGCIGYFSIYAFVLCNCLSLYRPLIIICIIVLFTCLSHTLCHSWMIDPIHIFLIWSNGWCIQGGRKCIPHEIFTNKRVSKEMHSFCIDSQPIMLGWEKATCVFWKREFLLYGMSLCNDYLIPW